MDSRAPAETQRRQQQVVDVEEGGEKSGGESNFPIRMATGQTNFKVELCAAAPLLPLLHTSCDSPNHGPWPMRERFLCPPPRPQSRTTFTRKPALPENQPNFLQSACGLAPGQILFPSFFLYSLATHAPRSP